MALGAQGFSKDIQGGEMTVAKSKKGATTGSSGQWQRYKNGTFRVGNCLELSGSGLSGAGKSARHFYIKVQNADIFFS